MVPPKGTTVEKKKKLCCHWSAVAGGAGPQRRSGNSWLKAEPSDPARLAQGTHREALLQRRSGAEEEEVEEVRRRRRSGGVRRTLLLRLSYERMKCAQVGWIKNRGKLPKATNRPGKL